VSACVAPIKGTVMRVVRLDACGAPVSGSDGQVVSNGFVSIAPSPQYEDGEEFVQRNANGELCVNEKDADALKRIDLTIQLCNVDVEMVELMLGARLITDGGDGIGFAIGEAPSTAKFGLEVWQQIAGGSCGGGVEQFVHHVFPWVENGRLNDFTIEYGPTLYEIGASTHKNPSYADGPFGLWTPPLEDDEHYAMQVTDVPPPSPVCGYQLLPA
jgi:hypothetical protein